MDHTERFITAFYYAVAGIFLGLGLAIFSSLYLSLTISSAHIVIFTVICCFVLGYVFPHSVGNIFKWVWHIFVHQSGCLSLFNPLLLIQNQKSRSSNRLLTCTAFIGPQPSTLQSLPQFSLLSRSDSVVHFWSRQYHLQSGCQCHAILDLLFHHPGQCIGPAQP